MYKPPVEGAVKMLYFKDRSLIFVKAFADSNVSLSPHPLEGKFSILYFHFIKKKKNKSQVIPFNSWTL